MPSPYLERPLRTIEEFRKNRRKRKAGIGVANNADRSGDGDAIQQDNASDAGAA